MDPPPISKPKPGRPRALDEAKCREIVSLLAAGCDVIRAAKHVGCDPSTIRREALRDPEFSAAIARARTMAELSPLNALRQAAATDWRAAAWFLERTNPQRFAKQSVTLVKPEHLSEFVEMMYSVVREETNDPELYRRVWLRFQKLCQQLETELAERNNPYSLRRHARKLGRTTAPPPDFQDFDSPADSNAQ